MTFSITAYCPQTGDLGIAVSTAIPAVGAINPFARAHVGAIVPTWVSMGWRCSPRAYRRRVFSTSSSEVTRIGRNGSSAS